LEPLNTKLSSLPLAVFRFRIRNPTSQPQTVSLAALMINPVGYEAKVDIHGISHPNFGGNINDFFREGQAAGLLMRAEAGEKATLDRAVSIYTLANLQDLTAPPIDRPENLKVEILKPPVLPASKLTDPTSVIIWLEEAATTLSESFLSAAREMVRAGGTLVFSGAIMPLLQEYAAVTDGKPLNEAALRPDILFEDFEHGYLNWKIEGEAFGQEPAHGTLPNQQPVSGFIGKSLVNSFVNRLLLSAASSGFSSVADITSIPKFASLSVTGYVAPRPAKIMSGWSQPVGMCASLLARRRILKLWIIKKENGDILT
jgi:hypothetical protein